MVAVKKMIITVSRQYGSGGRVIAKELAQRLGIAYYDKELIVLAAKESGFAEEIFEEAEEKTPNSLLYSLVMGTYGMGGQGVGVPDMPISDKVFLIQSDLIRSLAAKESAVFVGRCADYVLEGREDTTNLFLYAPLPVRIRRAVAEYGLAPEKSESAVLRIDKRRANYYNYYANRKWGKVDNYDLAVDTSKLAAEDTVSLLQQYIEMKYKKD